MPNASVLIVDDEPLIRWSLVERLSEEGYRIARSRHGEPRRSHSIAKASISCCSITRCRTPTASTVLKQIKEPDPDTLVILLTAYSSVDNAVEAMKHGAYHYANKPFNLDEIALLVDQGAGDDAAAPRSPGAARHARRSPTASSASSARATSMAAVRALLQKIAASPASTVLLTGESGTGKDLAAKVLHYASDRAAKPFMNITCSALPETLLESELFGHERGAFTGARSAEARAARDRPTAARSSSTRSARWCRRCRRSCCGSSRRSRSSASAAPTDIQVDVRVVAATNRKLEEEVKERTLPRGSVLPPQRAADRAAAAARARRRHPAADRTTTSTPTTVSSESGCSGVAPAAIERAASLRLAGQRARAAQCRRARDAAGGGDARAERFPGGDAAAGAKAGAEFELPAHGIDLEQLERSLVVQALERSGWNQTRPRTARAEPRSDPLSHREVQGSRVRSRHDRCVSWHV